MCEPTTLAVIGLAGSGVSAYGQYQAGQSAKQAGEYQAAVARNNVVLANRKADETREVGRSDAVKRQLQLRAAVGNLRADTAGRGVEIGSGSALDTEVDIVGAGQQDALTIRNNAEKRALAFEAQAGNFEADAQLATMKGENAARAGTIGAAGSFMTSAGSVGQKWYEYKKAENKDFSIFG